MKGHSYATLQATPVVMVATRNKQQDVNHTTKITIFQKAAGKCLTKFIELMG